MKNNQDIYKKLKKKYTDKELAEGFYLSKELSSSDQKELDKEIWTIRKKLLNEMTPEDRIYSGLLKIKYQIEAYVNSRLFDPAKTVACFLKEYMKVLDRKQKEMSSDLGIHKTRLSRILNEREKLSIQLAYRLEIHSGELIPAILWWKLLQKQIEKEIKENEQEKRKEKKNVKNIALGNR